MITDKESHSEIKKQIHDLKKEYDVLKHENATILDKLSVIKSNIRAEGFMDTSKYKTYCDAQKKHRKKRVENENKMRNVKLEIEKLNDKIYFGSEVNVIQNPNSISPEIVKELSSIRLKYQEFSADHTRVSSMRKMAAQFALDLNNIIRKIING